MAVITAMIGRVILTRLATTSAAKERSRAFRAQHKLTEGKLWVMLGFFQMRLGFLLQYLIECKVQE